MALVGILLTVSTGLQSHILWPQAAAGQAAAELAAVQQRLERQTTDMEACRAQVITLCSHVACDNIVQLFT